MSWAVGEDTVHPRPGRFIGYGVPATCDQPSCDKQIDRGLDYACGGGPMEDMPNCGLHFCSEHLYYAEYGPDRQRHVCERCLNDEGPFPAKPDVDEWVQHVLTDDSWAKFRSENPGWCGYKRGGGAA